MNLSVFVPGIPAPQGSKRHLGRGILVESSAQVKPWRATIAATIGPREPILGPVVVSMRFEFTRPRSHYGTGRNADRMLPSAPAYHTQRPDTDKLARAVLDALTQAGVWRDDSQVVGLYASKWWVDISRPPGVTIDVEDVGAGYE